MKLIYNMLYISVKVRITFILMNTLYIFVTHFLKWPVISVFENVYKNKLIILNNY